MNTRGTMPVAVYAVVFLVVTSGVGFGLAYEQVNEGHIGVKTQLGAVTGDTALPGGNFIVPIYQGMKHVEVRPRTYTMTDTEGEGKKKAKSDAISAPTNDGVDARIDVTIRYRVDASRASQFVSTWHSVEQAEVRLIRPTVRSAIRDEAGAIDTSDIYTKEGRLRLEDAVATELRKEFKNEALVLESVQVRNVVLPESYQRQLEKKEIEKQKVLQAQYAVDRAEMKKKQTIIEAEAEAEKVRIEASAEADAIRDVRAALTEEYVNYVFVQKLDETDNVYFFGDSSSGSNRPYLVKNVDENSNSTAENSNDGAP